MKKIVIVVILALAAVFSASAQPKAGGMRFGTSYEISYQHQFARQGHFFEECVGAFLYGMFYEATTFNFMVAHPKWTRKGTWGMYVGPGIGLGMGGSQGVFAGTFDGLIQFGIEYKFDKIPLQLSIDTRPQFGFTYFAMKGWGSGVGGFNLNGLWGFLPTMGVRYAF